MTETLYTGCEDTLRKLSNDMLRDHIARVLGPSPFDFRGRHLMSHEQARQIADDVVDAMDKAPDKGAAILRALYSGEDE